jgi:pimeloyl-ACP methyl ester carboxylesterase
MRLLLDVAAGPHSGAADVTPGVRRSRHLTDPTGDLYWPDDGAGALMVLVPGLSPDGLDDPRLVAFATSLAGARFAVFVPALPNLRLQRISPDDAEVIAASVAALTACFEPGAQAEMALAAISYAVAPTIMAALRPDTANHIGLVLAVGGYYDIEAAITFFTTGYHRDGPGEPWRYREPNAFGKWVFVRANADRLTNAEDRRILIELATRKLRDPHTDVTATAQRLGHEGRSVMALIDNSDPDRVPALIGVLPSPILDDLRALDLAHYDLSALRARLILLHGRDDPIIPASESRALAAAVSGGNVDLHIVDSLAHVELGWGGIGDSLSMWRAAYGLLAVRDALPAPNRPGCLAIPRSRYPLSGNYLNRAKFRSLPEVSRWRNGPQHLWTFSPMRAPPASGLGFGLITEPPLAVAGVDPGMLIEPLAGRVKDALAAAADIALDSTTSRRRWR